MDNAEVFRRVSGIQDRMREDAPSEGIQRLLSRGSRVTLFSSPFPYAHSFFPATNHEDDKDKDKPAHPLFLKQGAREGEGYGSLNGREQLRTQEFRLGYQREGSPFDTPVTIKPSAAANTTIPSLFTTQTTPSNSAPIQQSSVTKYPTGVEELIRKANEWDAFLQHNNPLYLKFRENISFFSSYIGSLFWR
eukprot:TRINITY_DN2324_c0_g1_i1.p1 TRINITY_DN2324_c0_g1~~TRINITY_DN2324_c0_g1_i1.p1  ORF type:complete len:205 (+),score=42.00 TRINITY_DN2324_c0_g1_i1:44-616(+)